MVSKYKPIPISAAKDIAKRFKKSQVIVVTWDAEHGKTHITTYGINREQCRQAAQGGEAIAKALGLVDEPVDFRGFPNIPDSNSNPIDPVTGKRWSEVQPLVSTDAHKKLPFQTSPFFCHHANEVPAQCTCPGNCYCRAPENTCGARKESVSGERKAMPWRAEYEPKPWDT